MRNLFSFLIATVCILFLPAAACGDAAKDAAKTGAGIVVDCTTGEAAKAVHELGPLAEKVVIDAIDPSGKVDWSPVKELGKKFSAQVGGCVLADVIGRVLNPKPDDPNAPKVGGMNVDLAAVRAGFAQTKVELFGDGVTFQTSSGPL